MSDTDELAENTEKETVPIQQEQPIKLSPLYQQFTPRLIVLLFTIIVMVVLTTVLFFHSKSQNNALVENQLIPLTQKLKQIEALQKASELVNHLLAPEKAENFVALHAELVTTDQQLLRLNSANTQTFQQWLNANKLAEDTISRIQDSHTRNQQLKQSSVIQLQLMLFSMTPIIDKKLVEEKSLHKRLLVDQAKSRLTFSKANRYAKAALQY